ncbi:AAA family ATPase, partial [Candidatus Poribacteria bacterium]|nr:AAA family ATPase [Candidatus Poribacteria bacterium]
MKLCKLKLKNINSFRDEIEIDFEDHPLNEASLVAITGPTGSGKTTILDAICVALYGKTPRLTGSSTRNPKNLISHGEKECSAEVHFLANETRYIAVWEGKKKGSPKGSLKNVDSNELITEKLSKKGKAMGDSESTVSDEIISILGLDFDAFTRSVMLAQGEFAAFLKASPEDRREILEATAGIHIYDKLRETLNEKVNEVTDTYNEIDNKLQRIPNSSTELLTEATDELESLQSEAKKLGLKNQQILGEKEAETDRTEKFNKLQTSEDEQNELRDQQHMIDTVKSELKRAEDANQLQPEKLDYDNTKSEFDTKTEELQQVKTELDEAKQQVDVNQTDFVSKDKEYNAALSERDQKTEVYYKALLEVNQASNQFEQANLRKAEMKEIDNNIETSTGELTEKKSRQNELQIQIDEANAFLTENPLPSDRHPRLTRVSNLLTKSSAQRSNLQEKTERQSEHNSNIDNIKKTLKQLSKKKDEFLSDKDDAEGNLEEASNKLTTLQETGSVDYWQQEKEIARNALPIAQQYETTSEQIREKKDDISDLQEHISTNNESLIEIQNDLEVQTQLCKRADAKVAELEAERELARLASPINTLRQQLEPGTPCKVCGATDHPYSDKVETEDDDLHDKIYQKLRDAQE